MHQGTDSRFTLRQAIRAAFGVSALFMAGVAPATHSTPRYVDDLAAQTRQAAADNRLQRHGSEAQPMQFSGAGGEKITLPNNANGVVTVEPANASGAALQIGLPGGLAAPAVSANGTLVYEANHGYVTAQVYDTDLRIATIFENSEAPASVMYRLGAHTRASANNDGSLTLGYQQPATSNAGHVWAPVVGFASVDSPWAKDANGMRVSTRFDIVSGAIIQHIDHEVSQHAYPVIADPRVVFEPLPWIYLSRLETGVASVVGGAASLCGIIGNIPVVGPIGQSICSSQINKVAQEAAVQVAKNSCVAYLFAPPLVVAKGHKGDFCE